MEWFLRTDVPPPPPPVDDDEPDRAEDAGPPPPPPVVSGSEATLVVEEGAHQSRYTVHVGYSEDNNMMQHASEVVEIFSSSSCFTES